MLLKNKLLQIKNLRKYFSLDDKILKAVNDVSFDVFSSETLGLVGESGCGKSTISKLILNLHKPTGGDILFENKSIYSNEIDKTYLNKNLQIIFQDPYSSLNPRMTVQDIISEPLKIHKICKKNEINDHVDTLLNQVNLSPSMKGYFPHEFSGGQRQRIGIARALALKPKFIVCDEPISALDVSIQAQIINLLKDLQEKYQLTYLFISHDIAMVKHISTRVLVMYLGEIMEIAKTQDIFKNPQHPYTKALFSAIPIISKNKREKQITLKGDVTSHLNIVKGCVFASRCPYKKKICLDKKPLSKQVSNDHLVRCHLMN